MKHLEGDSPIKQIFSFFNRPVCNHCS
uniref:Uncharacterized protein n=1 Tax=Anguilla anguilla TaxID=7936 RepID=A0A0E9RUG9_ANGAN